MASSNRGTRDPVISPLRLQAAGHMGYNIEALRLGGTRDPVISPLRLCRLLSTGQRGLHSAPGGTRDPVISPLRRSRPADGNWLFRDFAVALATR